MSLDNWPNAEERSENSSRNKRQFGDEDSTSRTHKKSCSLQDDRKPGADSQAKSTSKVSNYALQQDFHSGQEVEYRSHTRRYAAEIISVTDEEINVKVDYGTCGTKRRTVTKRQQIDEGTIRPANTDTHVFTKDRRTTDLQHPQRGSRRLTKHQLQEIARENENWVRSQEPQTAKRLRRMHTDSDLTWYPQRPITEITIVDNDAISTAINAERMWLGPTAVHNFACRSSPGGGYRRGIEAQEEDLCRSIPALVGDLNEKQYPIGEAEVLVTRHAEIRRRMHQETIEREPLATVTILTSAMPNIREYGWTGTRQEYTFRLTREIEALILTATKERIRTLITGAPGCGAFGNSPRDVASAFVEVLKNRAYAQKLPRIIFAIMDTKARENRRIFEEEIQSLISEHMDGPGRVSRSHAKE